MWRNIVRQLLNVALCWQAAGSTQRAVESKLTVGTTTCTGWAPGDAKIVGQAFVITARVTGSLAGIWPRGLLALHI
jgi:hypothetical protein